jgi:hypothetical protein
MGSVVLMGAIAGAVSALRRAGGALLSGRQDCAPRQRLRRSQIALIMLVAVSGCGGTGSHTGTAAQAGDLLGHGRADDGATDATEAMLIVVSDDQRIRNTSEATAARQRAIRTELASLPLLKELALPGLSEAERSDKKREIERLREQYKREMTLVEAFHKELERKLKEAEGVFALKDPEVERMRGELTRIIERKGEDEREAIERVQREFERRREELAHK